MVSTTYGYKNGYMKDCDDTTGWAKQDSADPLTSPALAIDSKQYFKISGTPDAVADEWVAYYLDITNFSSDVYTKYLVRWKTSASANGLGARAKLVFTSGEQDLLESSGVPQYSTTWTVKSGTVTAGKTIDSVQFIADDYPNSVASGTYDVYFDFMLIHKDTFTFPYGPSIEFSLPPKYAILSMPGRVGNVTQNLGSSLATVRIYSNLDMKTASWKRTGDYVEGEVFYDIAHNSDSEPWQWLDTGKEQFKVTLEDPMFRRIDQGGKVTQLYNLLFREYRLGDASGETYVERFGLDL